MLLQKRWRLGILFLTATCTDLSLQEPEAVQKLLDAIQSIVDEARRALADPELSREALLFAVSVRLLIHPHGVPANTLADSHR